MGVISYASRATAAPIHQAISAVDTSMPTTTTIPSSTTTLVAAASVSASTSATPSSTPSDGELANYIPWYFVLFAIPLIFILVAVWSLIQDHLEDKRKAARAGEEDIELRALERHWFPWREALDEDEVGGYRPWRRASPPPPPDRRTKKEIAAAEAAAKAAAAKKQKAREEALANASRSSTPNSTVAEVAGPSSRLGEPSGTQTQTGNQHQHLAAAGAPQSARTSTPTSPSVNSHVTQFPCGPVSSRRRSPRNDPRIADLEGVFVVGTDSDDDESEAPRGRTRERQGKP